VSAREFAERFIAAERADMAALGVLAPDVDPKATEHVPQMIDLIARLVASGHATDRRRRVFRDPELSRPTAGSPARISTSSWAARASRSTSESATRVISRSEGREARRARVGQPVGTWTSRLAHRVFGDGHEVPGTVVRPTRGGEDLIFPHHECEIAQAEACTGQPFARYWAHNGMVNMGKEKMSKSLGNT